MNPPVIDLHPSDRRSSKVDTKAKAPGSDATPVVAAWEPRVAALRSFGWNRRDRDERKQEDRYENDFQDRARGPSSPRHDGVKEVLVLLAF